MQRLSPVTLVGHASEKGLGHAAAQVLAPHFHREDSGAKKVTKFLRNASVIICGIGFALD